MTAWIPRSEGRRSRPDRLVTVHAFLARTVPVCLWLYVATAFLGLLVSPLRTALLEAPVVVVVLLSGYVTAYRTFLETWPSRPAVHRTGWLAYAVPLYFGGAEVLGGVGAVMTLALVLVAAVDLWARVRATSHDVPVAGRPVSAAGNEPRTQNDGALRELLSTMSLRDLFDEWHGTQVHDGLLPTSPELAGARLKIRRLLIDELRRRDPSGVDRWLAEAPAQGPENYVDDPEPPGPSSGS